MAPNVFSVPVFLIVFRETLETVIIVSVLLAYLKQTLGGPDRDAKVYKDLRRQVWLGTGIGLLICLVVAATLIGVFYRFGANRWEGDENYYEGAFALFAAIIITIMGGALLRIGKMQEKWRLKLAKALDSPMQWRGRGKVRHFLEKYAMFILPFVTVLREGIEAIIFVAGVSLSAPATAFPLPAIVGLAFGCFVGWLLYKGGSTSRLQLFLVASTCLLYLVAAGLFSRSVGYFETAQWNKVIGGEAEEFGDGPGSYDIDQSVWHINCCSPDAASGSGWTIFNAILGWTNSATYGTVLSYNLYWVFVIIMFVGMKFRETHGHLPFMKRADKTRPASAHSEIATDVVDGGVLGKGASVR